jgi:excisionase family DNA binding protein
MQPDAVSLDAHVRAIVREALDDVVRAALAPVLADLATLKAAAPPALGTVEEAAERLHVSPATIRRWLDSRAIVGRKIGRAWRVDLGALKAPSPDAIKALADAARGAR